MKRKTGRLKKTFDKYSLYRRAVQAPDVDVLFLRDVYKELSKRKPGVLREDFCGTFAISTEWVKLGKGFSAHAVDLDGEPIQYGMNHYYPKLKLDQQRRLQVHQGDVLRVKTPPVDVIAAMNFSFFIFKRRDQLKTYFKKCLRDLAQDGLLIVDTFGGSACYEANEEHRRIGNFVYYWDQENFDPVTNEARFHIHFKLAGQKRFDRVFSYDWRMWSIPEIREIMREAGFRSTHVYWEGTTRAGGGDGDFKRVEKGEECDSWIAYVVGQV